MRRMPMFVLAMLVLLGGCTPIDTPSYAPPATDRLLIYTSHKQEVYGPIVKEFEQRTGIWVQVETGGTAELLERIDGEKANVRCDIMFGGGVESLEAYKDCFAPYESSHAVDLYENYRSADNRWVPFSSLPIVIIYNPKLVTGTRPVSWNSLLEPYWQGKIAFADPQKSGSSYTALATMLQALPLEGEETMRRFTANLGGQLLERSSDVSGAVADGRCYVGITVEDTALKDIAAGYDIAMAYPQEGTSAVPDGAAVVAGCAHEDNARRFIDFILSAEVQKRLDTFHARRSVRTDMFEPETQTQGFVLLEYDMDWASDNRASILNSWKYMMGEAKE